MTKEEIFEVLKRNIVDIIPELEGEDMEMQQSLKDLGANSIDRMDIIVQTMEDLEIKIPMLEFGNLANMEGIVDLLHSKL